MAHKAPGKSHREGITLVQLVNMFPTEEAATAWFEAIVWDEGRYCGKCGIVNTREVPNAKPMPYWCSGLQILLLDSHRHPYQPVD